jgi:hypothetical protein
MVCVILRWICIIFNLIRKTGVRTVQRIRNGFSPSGSFSMAFRVQTYPKLRPSNKTNFKSTYDRKGGTTFIGNIISFACYQ